MQIPRTTFVIITLLIISTTNFNSQTKKEVQFSLDTLIKSHESLLNDYKSMKEAWKKQNNFFEHVKTNFFDPTDINTPIDKGIEKFDMINQASISQLEELENINLMIKDSLQYYKNISQELDNENKTYNKILLSSLKKTSFPQSKSELIGTWDLFLNPLQIKGEPYSSGIIGFNSFNNNDSILKHNIYKIEFSEDEIATLYFSNSTTQKSFYSVKDFSKSSPYSITFSKNEDFKLNLHISPLPEGLMVSYEAPVKSDRVYYFYGLMKK